MNISVLRGLVVSKVKLSDDKECLTFYTDNGRVFEMWHKQNCCENVILTDIEGNLDDLESLIISAEESTSGPDDNQYGESGLWTFYRFQTAAGYVVLRWEGYSDYYSLSVDFNEVSQQP